MSENNHKEKPENGRPEEEKQGQRSLAGKSDAKRGYQGKKPYARPAGQGQGSGRSAAKPAYGKPAFNKDSTSQGERKPYARPAGQSQGGERSFAKPAYGKPAFNKDSTSQGERKPYARPAGQGQGGERSFAKPAFGKPAFNKDRSSQGERKPYARPAGQSQSGERSFAKPAYGKPAFNQDRPSQGERKPYARPTGQGQGGERGFAKPAYGKPAFNKDSSSQNERKVYGRPAPQSSGGERSFTKPAYGRPAFNKSPATEGERKVYGRPAPQAQGVEGSFVKPAFSTSPALEGERKVYGRPAPQSSGGEHKPYGRPAPQGQGGERSFARPAYGKPAFNRDSSTQGERKPYGRPAPQGQGGERSFGKPSFSRSAPERSFGRDTYSRPSAPVQNQERFGRPSFRQAGTDDKPFDRSSQSRPSFSRPGAPRPSYNRSSPARTDFRRQGGFSQTSPRNDGSLSADARKSAMLVLNRVLLESGYASLSLDEHFDKVNLSQRDKRLCTRIVYLTLENLNRLDFALDKLLEDPERVEKRVRNILRLSAAQILLLDRVPDSAAVNEAVKLVRELELEDLTGLVNGVLRNLIRGKEDIKWPTKADGLDYYHIMHSLPMWYIQKILEEYGTEEGEKILSYRKDEHHMTIRLNPLRISEEKFEELLSRKTWKSQKGIMPGAFYVTGVSDVAADIDYLDGLFSIQGEGSMMAAEAVQPKLGAQVLDTCAAPGGKSAYLAEMMQGTGRVQAWDIYEHRVELIKAMSERLRHYNIRPAVRDALVYREQLDGLMDAVLIDAPCTGTGVLDDKPDLRHHLNEESLKELTEIQSRLLETCSRYVRTGGTLVYATCSILPEENVKQVEAFLASHPDFSMDALPDSIPQTLRENSQEYGLQLLSYRDKVEGFYIARMKRK